MEVQKSNTSTREIKELISKGNLSKALQDLRQLIQSINSQLGSSVASELNHIENTSIILSNKYSTLNQQRNANVIDETYAQRNINRLAESTLLLINDFEKVINQNTAINEGNMLESSSKKVEITINSKTETFSTTDKKKLLEVIADLLGKDVSIKIIDRG